MYKMMKILQEYIKTK